MNGEHKSEKVQIKLPAEVAKIMGKWGGHGVRLAAARGALPMSGLNLVMVLFVFYHGDNQELKEEALSTLQTLPAQILLAALTEPQLHPAIIDLIVHLRYEDAVVMQAVLAHPMTGIRSLLFVAEKSSGDVLDMLADHDEILLKSDVIRKIIINNPNADKVTRLRLGWVEPQEDPAHTDQRGPGNKSAAATTQIEETAEADAVDVDECDEESLSKYQQLQEMTVNEKIKMALTGDKEWRTLLIREANKQINTGVLRNPRITEGEVLAVAQNRSSSEELIRVILLNREWVKLYDMKKALVHHPRTPVQQAMRMMNFLSERDIKELAISRNVTQPIINNARRMLTTKKK
ncbi:MAG: hypothetical protein K0A94_05260 [Desulfuromonadales bacterium]|nr:hypothetical protein [Desulfuromonadales bacterium]